MDVSSIPYGVDFKRHIGEVLQQCAVMLVIIGPMWLDTTDDSGKRRLDDPHDIVRIEVETGLERGIPLVPVMVEGAHIPRTEQLPAGMKRLSDQNGVFVGADPGLDRNFGRLMTDIAHKIPPNDQDPGWERFLPRRLAELGFRYRSVDGVSFIVPPVCEVPAGAFTMGSTVSENEKPLHDVTLPQFWIGMYPVTVAEYACFLGAMRAGLLKTTGWQNQQVKRDHPVVSVSWRDAIEYGRWLADRTGQAWRLPTEAEWERAASWDADKNVGRVYPWGDSFDSALCNTEEGRKQGTTAVGAYPKGASQCGAQDMSGNVWEWTSSLYKGYPYASTDGRESLASEGNRVKRGGSWDGYASSARTAKRMNSWPDQGDNSTGFRLVLGVSSFS